jgi:peroxin-7
MAVLQGHEYAVRKLAWSLHLSDVLLSASYDMTCRVWTDGTSNAQVNGNVHLGMGGPRELGRMSRHMGFILGADWCLFGAEEGYV